LSARWTDADAIAEWNRRTPPPVATVTREELEDVLWDHLDDNTIGDTVDRLLALLSKPT
jgi:hypothetical protein